jgi:hypothetical protein
MLVGPHYLRVDAPVALDRALARAGAVPVERRTAIVAVGSNAAPDVLRRKLARAGAGAVVPFLAVSLDHIGVGHSAHVSAPGFVAAAPYHSPGAVTPAVVALLDDQQLRCVDTSEPNYRRRLIDEPGQQWIYESRWGVLATSPGDARPLPLCAQDALLAHLVERDDRLGALLGRGDTQAVLAGLAADPARRDAIRAHLAGTWARPSGLYALG